MNERSFIRCLFGPPNPEIEAEIAYLMEGDVARYNEPFMTYVCGAHHVEILEKYDLPYKLLTDDAWLYKEARQSTKKFGNKFFFQHKLRCIEEALTDYREILFLDWDAYPVRELPDDFWSELSAGHHLKVPLYCRRMRNRGEDQIFPGRWPGLWMWVWKYNFLPIKLHPMPNAGFIYLRGQTVIKELMAIADSLEDHIRQVDETALGLFIERELGEERVGLRDYFATYEPNYCDGAVEGTGFREQSAFKIHCQHKGMRAAKDICFWHMAGEATVAGYLGLQKDDLSRNLGYLPSGKRLRKRFKLRII